VWLFGSDHDSNRPNTYAGIVNEKCEQLAPPAMVNQARDANDGAPDVTYLGGGNFVAGYYSDGGGDVATFPGPGGDYSVALGLPIASGAVLPTLERKLITAVVTPTNIGRPTIATVDSTHALFCAPKGPDRPSDSVECALLDGIGGT